MEILFANSKLERDCCESKRRTLRFGPKQAVLIRRRLDEMYAAANLADLRTLPQVRCHELTGDRKGQLSVDLSHPYRLVFRVEGDRPKKPDGGLDWSKVTAVKFSASRTHMTKKAANAYHPDSVSPPGETLQELLEHQGMAQAELAERTGRPKKTINEIVNGKAAITPETALQFEKVLGVPARFWISREAAYQEWKARAAEATELESDSKWVERFPIAEMVKRGWIAASTSAVGTMREVLRFFGIARPSLANKRSASFRRSHAFEIDEAATEVWLQQAINVARDVATAPYDEVLFRRELETLRRYSRKHVSPAVPEVVTRCASAGVAVVSVEELPGTRISGATLWAHTAKAVIALTFRNRTDDHLWFAFFHEAGHVLLHPRGDAFVERKVERKARDLGQRDGSGTIDQEAEADEFARDTLIPRRQYEEFVGRGECSAAAIERFARELEIAPGIVVGRLQNEGDLPWATTLNKLKRSIPET